MQDFGMRERVSSSLVAVDCHDGLFLLKQLVFKFLWPKKIKGL